MKKYEKLFLISGIFLFLSEAVKQILLTYAVNNGVYSWWYFPFQLCSLPMYLLPVCALTKSQNIKRTILTFLMTYNLLGGFAVFFDTSGMQYPLHFLTVHSYVWHILLILIGIISGQIVLKQFGPTKRNTRIPLRMFLHSTLLYLFFGVIASVINMIVTPFDDINMFYINPVLPMEQIFFVRLSALLGNSVSIALYMAATILGSFLIFTAWGRKRRGE